MQYPSDMFLVKLVQVQQLAQSISLAMSTESGQSPSRLPLTMVVQSFEVQIESFRASLSIEFRNNRKSIHGAGSRTRTATDNTR